MTYPGWCISEGYPRKKTAMTASHHPQAKPKRTLKLTRPPSFIPIKTNQNHENAPRASHFSTEIKMHRQFLFPPPKYLCACCFQFKQPNHLVASTGRIPYSPYSPFLPLCTTYNITPTFIKTQTRKWNFYFQKQKQIDAHMFPNIILNGNVFENM